MQFTVPQFIEKEAKIVGPFTFKQFVFIGVAGGICLLLYFIVPLYVFILATIFLLGGAFALAFVKIERATLPVFIKNLIIFLFSSKVYLWKKRGAPSKILPERKEEEEEIEIKEKPTPKIAEKSKLSQLFTRLETKNKPR